MNPQTILKLTLHNVLRCSVVDIAPDGNAVRLRGKNRQGKTSILNSIEMLFGGAGTVPDHPIHGDAERGEVIGETQDYIIKRVFTKSDTYLYVSSRDGAKISNPQEFLNGFIGSLSFDPHSFCTIRPEQRVACLAKLTGVDFAPLNKKREEAYSERTSVNRQVKQLQTRVDEAAKPIVGLKAEDFAEEMKVEDVQAELRAAQDTHSAHNRFVDNLRTRQALLTRTREKIARLSEEIKELEAEARPLAIQNTADTRTLEETTLPDLDMITAKFSAVSQHNNTVHAFRVLQKETADLAAAKDSSEAWTKVIDAIDLKKSDLLKAAELPVSNLTFDENGVYYNDLPFEQASDAEQLMVSTALGIALNPTLRVILVRNGSLLDSDSMKIVTDMAERTGHQIWIEEVAEKPDGVGIYIEDGQVAA
jgi:hypothetical protein